MTALEFIQPYLQADDDFIESMIDQMKSCSGFNFDNIPDLMAAYAKHEVEQALNEVLKVTHKNGIPRIIDDKNLILNAYPLDNIKPE